MTLPLTYRETDIVALLKQKDHEAFASLYDRYSPALYSFALQIVKEQEIANNVIQKVFIYAWHNIVQYDSSKERLFTWLLKTSRRIAIDETRLPYYRQQAAQKQVAGDGVLHGVSPASVDSCGLKKVINQLNTEHETLINLSYYEGFTYQQIAETLDIPSEVVRKNIRIALKELNTMLG